MYLTEKENVMNARRFVNFADQESIRAKIAETRSTICFEVLEGLLQRYPVLGDLRTMDPDSFRVHAKRSYWDESVDGANYVKSMVAYVQWMINQSGEYPFTPMELRVIVRNFSRRLNEQLH